MKEIDSNKAAWSLLSEEHYQTYKARLENGKHHLNHIIQAELPDITGQDIIHLQCNTGADSIALSMLGADRVVGVDLVSSNVYYAKKLADDLAVKNVEFIESDIMTLRSIYDKQHDIVFTSEGVLGWLPDLNIWAQTIHALLHKDGFLYLFDSHPFFLMFDESLLDQEKYILKYPYFAVEPDMDTSIGGYASEVKNGVQAYFWLHSISEIINALTQAGLTIEYIHEFPENFYDSGNMQPSTKEGLYEYKYNKSKYPMSFSLKATK